MARPDSTLGADATIAAGLLLLGVLLSVIGAGLLDQWQESIARNHELTVDQILGAAATASGAILLLWWLLSLASAAASLILEKRGRMRAAAAAGNMAPAFMRRLVIATVSFQLLSGAAANAASPGPEWAPTSQGQERTSTNTGDNALAREQAAGTPASPASEAPSSDTPPSTFEPGWQPREPVVKPGPLAASPVRGDFSSPATGWPAGAVTVLAGDSLWGIVANHLGHGASDVDIALEWPRWYEANRELIGQNPDVLLPGQVLLPPAPA
jgi:hypothetical protein